MVKVVIKLNTHSYKSFNLLHYCLPAHQIQSLQSTGIPLSYREMWGFSFSLHGAFSERVIFCFSRSKNANK